MTEKMAEEGTSTSGTSGIVKFKDNFVKITKDRKKFIFIVTKSLELIFSFIAATIEGYKSFFNPYPATKIPEYKDMVRYSDMSFRVVCTALDGFMIFNLILLVLYLLGEQLSKKLLLIFSIFGAIFCLAAGSILVSDSGDSNVIYNQNKSTDLIVSGVFAYFTAVAFAIEAITTYKSYS